jgi:hypothetical protein
MNSLKKLKSYIILQLHSFKGFPSENVLAMYQRLSPFKLQVRGHNLNKKDTSFYNFADI